MFEGEGFVVEDLAFSSCTSLYKLYLPVATLVEDCFDRHTTLYCPAEWDSYSSTYSQSYYPVVILPDARLTLPASLSEVGAEAFEGSAAAWIRVPNGCGAIGSRAFAGNTALRYLSIPGSVTEIAPDMLDGCGNVIIFCPIGSAAAAWADAHGCEWIAG